MTPAGGEPSGRVSAPTLRDERPQNEKMLDKRRIQAYNFFDKGESVRRTERRIYPRPIKPDLDHASVGNIFDALISRVVQTFMLLLGIRQEHFLRERKSHYESKRCDPGPACYGKR